MLFAVLLIGRVPPAPLSAYISILWYSEAWKPPYARQRHMPDGSMGVIIPLNDGAREEAIVSGPRSGSIFLDTSRPFNVLGIGFKYGAASHFLTVPAGAMANEFVSLADAAPGGGTLRQQLLETPDPDAKLDLVQAWLMERLLRGVAPEPAITWAVGELLRRPAQRVSAVADQIGRSSRWFADRFARDIGLTPKVFTRVQRFQRALRWMQRDADLADVAIRAGYYDQPHFVHDFGAIAHMTPSEYLAGRTDHPNHVDLPD
jgi:AraC-like DNA-binding protein